MVRYRGINQACNLNLHSGEGRVASVSGPRAGTGKAILMRMFGIFTFSILAIAVVRPVQAQEWQRLPDGRVVIEVKGVRLAMPTAGSELSDIHFSVSSTEFMDLKHVIDSPDQARKFFEKNNIRWVEIPNLTQRDGLFLGRFSRNNFRSLNFSVSVGAGAQNNCRAWSQLRDQYRLRISVERMPVDSNGWAEFINYRSPTSWNYVSAQDRAGLPKHFDSFDCDSFNFCTATSCIGSNAAFTYKFNRDVRKRDAWDGVIQNAADVFRFIFLDGP